MSASMTAVAVAIALLLCSLTAGFLFAFAVVVMPGLGRLGDAAYLRAFQVVDGVIQENQPLFILVWVGSIVAMLAVLGLGLWSLTGVDRTLLLGAGALYLVGVQVPTLAINVPLNNRVQGLDVDALDAPALGEARAAFETRWNRWNVIRTVLAVAAVVLLLLVTTPLSAQVLQPGADDLARMDERIRAEMAASTIPGVLIGVASRGRLLHVQGYGLADVELRVPVSDSTVFEIGSISKQFVAVAIMQLVEEGRVGLDVGIHEYLYDLPSEWLGVTVRQLLTHTSGIPDYEEIQTYEAYRFRFTPEEIIRVAHSRPMDFEPGTGVYYSNTGYFLLSLIVERVEGRPLGTVLRSRIFEPLGMGQTRMADPEDIIPHRASGYWVDRMGEALMNRDPTQTSSTLGAGGIVSSVHDMAKWDEALYGDRVLSEASRQLMWTSAVLPNGDETGYGFGWRLQDYRGRRAVGHGGMVAGFVANFIRLPDDDLAIIVFANRYRVSSSDIRDIVADTFLPD
jgi:D-alanyl-D-alanine carboxypeptidase